MRARRLSLAFSISVAGALGALASCSYDFDRFTEPSPTEGGRAGQASAGGEAGEAVSGGTGGSGGVPSVEAGAGGEPAQGGVPGEGGEGGAPDAGAGAGGGGEPDPGAACDALAGTLWNGSCYFVIARSTGLQWEAARSACATYSPSSHLVSIGSAEEQALLEATFFPSTDDYWIGLSLEDTSDTPSVTCRIFEDSCPFAWIDGTALDYTNWAVRAEDDVEPNYTGACVRMQLDNYAWADFGCTAGQLPAICEQ